MIHLRSISTKIISFDDRFPFNLPVVKEFTELAFTTPVTFF